MSSITLEKVHQLLNLEVRPNGSGAITVRGYLLTLLAKLWVEGESFNAKRPFGNSGWEREVVPEMIAAGLVAGLLDEDGEVATADYSAVDELVLAAIDSLDAPRVTTPVTVSDGKNIDAVVRT